jgi:hypothetical protein
MAINIKNYVDISTTFPSANVAGRSFGGLVFTAKDAIEQTSGDMAEAYEAYMGGGVTFLTLEEVGLLFGTSSDEYKFAEGYYGYISPSGRFASRIAYSKIFDNETPLAAFSRVNKVTNLFGSFTFLSVPRGGDSTSSETDDLESLKAVALFNSTLDAKYLFVVNRAVGDKTTDAVITECETFKDIKGTVYISGKTDVSAYMPMAILGSTDYSNGQVVNFMFKQFATEEPTVEDDKTYADFNKVFVNFYGRTQTNGQTLDFYQRGFNTDGTDTAVYCNEMWFKSICETALMNLLVSRERLPADALGVDLVKLEVVDCCADAIRNSMFMQKELTAKDIRGIRELVVSTGGAEADVGSIEADISTKGYSVYAYLSSMEDNQKLGPTSEKVIIYYVFYGTADSVRYIKGDDILLK